VTGSFTVRVVIDAEVTPGTALSISARMTDSDEEAVSTWDLSIR